MSYKPSIAPSGEIVPTPIPDPSGKGPLPSLLPSSYAPLPSGMPPPSYVPGSGTLVLPTATATNGPHNIIVTQLPRASRTPGLLPPSASGYPSPLPSYPPPPPGSSSVGPSVTFSPFGPATVSPDPFSSSASLHPLFPGSSPFPSLPPTASPSAELAAGAGLSPAEIGAVSGGGILICVFVLLLIIWKCLKQGSLPTRRQIRDVVAGAAGEAVIEMVNPMGARALSVSPAVTIRPSNSNKNGPKKGGKQKTRKQRGGAIQAKLFDLARQFTEMIMANGGIMNIPELVREMVPLVTALL